MSMAPTRRRMCCQILIMAAAVTFVSGCGKKGDLEAPVRQPAATETEKTAPKKK